MKFDVIVVLAGGITSQGGLPHSVLQRIGAAKQLYDQQIAPRILMSGKWSSYWEHLPPDQTEATLMCEYAVSLGIPRKAIFLEEHSQNTFENAFYTSKLFLEPNDWSKVLVVTSDFHLARTQRIFNRVLGKKYQTQFVGIHTEEGFIKQFQRQLKEMFLLPTQWFFQYFMNR